ncbi:MAG: hypothetical protein HY901_22465 [Deltaproteobacteria bacterium]|nr:hypothetical protein [Deltaproteobacteria bacterium]
MRLLWRPLLLHLGATAFFAWAGWRLWLEAPQLRAWQMWTERALAVASGLLVFISIRALVALAVTWPSAVVRGRRTSGDYLSALGAVLVLAFVAVRALGESAPRHALVAFSIGFAVWVIAVTFDLLPRLYLGEHRVSDMLGRGTAYSALEWFQVSGGPRRAVLEVGRADRVVMRARAIGSDADLAGALLLKKGLRERQ